MNAGRSLTCLIRGGGDLATGVAYRLHRARVNVIVTELASPLTVRRTVSLSTAVTDGQISVEGMVGVLTTVEGVETVLDAGRVAVVVSEALPDLHVDAVVDARMAKRNIDTTIDDAPMVVGLGPGFTPGVDCHAAIETHRGPHLGRVLWDSCPAANTGVPGTIGGKSNSRVLRSPASGTVEWSRSIGECVHDGDVIGRVGSAELPSPFAGVVRGLIRHGSAVTQGQKVGDVDPRLDTDCDLISDKALSIGGGAVDAVVGGPRRGGASE